MFPMSTTILCTAFLLLVILYKVVKRKVNYDYWKKRKVPYLKPTPLLGNYGEYLLMKKYLGKVAQEICQKFPNEPYVGAYYGTEPTLILQSPELIKLVIAKDFPYFNGREISKYTDKENVTRSLFFTHGDRWKVIRQNMSPLFTSSKIKNMFPLVEKCAHVFEELLDYELTVSDVLDVKDLIARYTMDCICSCGFGIDTYTMANTKDAGNNPFKKMGELLFAHSYVRGFAMVTRAVWPALFYGLRFSLFPKVLTDFFDSIITRVFKQRQYKPSTRNDFVDMVLNMKKEDYLTCESLSPKTKGVEVSLKVDNEFLASLCIGFFAAGYETSATTLSFTLYELAKDQEAQRRAIKEIDEYLLRHEGKIGYDCVNELEFLDACIDEAMRLYPILGVISREVMEDYTLPDGLRLEKGMRIHLPVYHLHHHTDYFPEPELFQPQRFLSETKRTITPYTYMPFGEGPRICIGQRLAKMQMLPGLVAMLKKYRVSLAHDTPRSLTFDPRSSPTRPIEGIHLRVEVRDDWQQRVFARSV